MFMCNNDFITVLYFITEKTNRTKFTEFLYRSLLKESIFHKYYTLFAVRYSLYETCLKIAVRPWVDMNKPIFVSFLLTMMIFETMFQYFHQLVLTCTVPCLIVGVWIGRGRGVTITFFGQILPPSSVPLYKSLT